MVEVVRVGNSQERRQRNGRRGVKTRPAQCNPATVEVGKGFRDVKAPLLMCLTCVCVMIFPLSQGCGPDCCAKGSLWRQRDLSKNDSDPDVEESIKDENPI